MFFFSLHLSATVEKRFKRAKILLSWHVGDEIVFSDEKMFVLTDISREKLTVPRYRNASAVMEWGAISRKGRLPLVFIDQGVKINDRYCKTEVLEWILLPEAQSIE
jgi:hypothetical protein